MEMSLAPTSRLSERTLIAFTLLSKASTSTAAATTTSFSSSTSFAAAESITLLRALCRSFLVGVFPKLGFFFAFDNARRHLLAADSQFALASGENFLQHILRRIRFVQSYPRLHKIAQFVFQLNFRFTSASPLLKSIHGIFVNGPNFSLINSRVASAAIPSIEEQ